MSQVSGAEAVAQPGFVRRMPLVLIAHGAAIVAAWILWRPGLGLLVAALGCVLAVWIVAGGITLWLYLAFSLAPLSDLLAAAWETSAPALWLVPGILLMASGSAPAAVLGLAAVISSTRLLISSRAPKGETIPGGWVAGESIPLLFHDQLEQPAFPVHTVRTMFGALAMQMGILALAGDYPLPAAVCFAAGTAICTGMALARGAAAPRKVAGVRDSAPRILLTLLLTATLTASLVRMEILPEDFGTADHAAAPAETSSLTRAFLRRLAHIPPKPAVVSKPSPAAAETVVTRLVGRTGVPGVVLHRPAKPRSLPLLVWPGARLRLSFEQALAIPFTGEYHLFAASSGTLPENAIGETGTPLENHFGTVAGGAMETVAVQPFDPPIDLTACGKVLVAVACTEIGPLLASMQLLAEEGVEDGGTELMGMNQGREETLEFRLQAAIKPRLVRLIRIQFQRPVERDKSVRVALEGFTLVPRGW